MLEKGFYPTLSNEEYHADPAISRSSIMRFHESPFKYWAHYLNPNRPPKKTTDAMKFGSAFHTFVLENKLFNELYEVEPVKVLLKDVGRKEYDEYKNHCERLEKSSKIILSDAQWYLIKEMQYALSRNSEAWELLQNAQYEQSYFWRDKESELMIKSRPDIVHDNMIIDLKTVASASHKSIFKAIFDYGYDLQMAIAQEGIFQLKNVKIDNFILICIEKEYPFSIGIYILEESIIENATRRYKDTLKKMKKCIEINDWKDYSINSISLPSWEIYG